MLLVTQHERTRTQIPEIAVGELCCRFPTTWRVHSPGVVLEALEWIQGTHHCRQRIAYAFKAGPQPDSRLASPTELVHWGRRQNSALYLLLEPATVEIR